MANCMLCGQRVTTAQTVHADCLDGLLGRICDEYCRYPYISQSQDDLDEQCSTCVIAAALRGKDVKENGKKESGQ